MAARRTRTIPPPNCSPRNRLAETDHALVDAILKDMKHCTRRLHAAFASQQVDLQVLEKLHYKGNNQHRTALFWRRVADIRKFGRRVEGADIYGLVESLRLSFWGGSVRDPKVLKGPWMSYPDSKTVTVVLHRLGDCRDLVRRMQDHVTKAHNHFNLELQTGAFLPLILTLTAISSRVAILLTEIEAAVEQGYEALSKVLLILDPTAISSVPRSRKQQTSGGIRPVGQVSTSTQSPSLELDGGEDLGMTLTSESSVANEKPFPPRAEEDGESDRERLDLNLQTADLMLVTSKSQITSNNSVRTTVQRTSIAASQSLVNGQRKHYKHKSVSQEGPPKKKKKKDEIDDIFGF